MWGAVVSNGVGRSIQSDTMDFLLKKSDPAIGVSLKTVSSFFAELVVVLVVWPCVCWICSCAVLGCFGVVVLVLFGFRYLLLITQKHYDFFCVV